MDPGRHLQIGEFDGDLCRGGESAEDGCGGEKKSEGFHLCRRGGISGAPRRIGKEQQSNKIQ